MVHMSTPVKLSVVIPAYNEENRLRKTLQAVEAWASDRTGLVEVVVVDDGSRDGTLRVAESWAAGIASRETSVLQIVVSVSYTHLTLPTTPYV